MYFSIHLVFVIKHFLCLTTNTEISNKKHFKEMNSYVGMTMVKKEQGQDDYFNQQSILLTLPAYVSPLNE